MWNYTIVGKIHKIDRRIAKVHRHFGFRYLVEKDSTAWLKKKLQEAVIDELKKREDKGYPWFGDAVDVIGPTYKFNIFIPHPEDRTQMELFDEQIS